MKNRKIVLIVLAALIVFSMAACDEIPDIPKKSYVSSDNTGNTYWLLLIAKSEVPKDFEWTPVSGDKYELTINLDSEPVLSSGTITTYTDGLLTLKHNDGGVFTVTISGNEMTNITGPIPLDSGSEWPSPGDVTPESGSNNDI